ncbi:MAG: thiamine-phosphate kinase [Bacteroidales bacterium]|nr:thiamine-phosphate kinase [Bacteroidales bacterium]MDT8431776.1 thiamine-phosphate kinase [Bacteroidales bacterium]
MSEERLRSIEELGEFGLIAHLTKDLEKRQESTLKGVGDDAAVIDFGSQCQVVTTDMLVEGIHFDLMYTPLKHLGYKSVIVNISDVYAMNAVPRQITVSVAISGKFSVEALEQFYEGVKMACQQYGVDMVGGDTSASLTGLMISVTALGTAPKKEIVYRSGAKVNNLACVTGDLGAAYMGLQVLEREKKVFEEDSKTQPMLGDYEYVVGRFLKPEVRVETLLKLRELEVLPTSMIDISDGLSSELLHICKESDCGVVIYQEKLPISMEVQLAAAEFRLEPLIPVLNGGEDYELLFTVPLSAHDKVKSIPGISIIGNITEHKGTAIMMTEQGQAIALQAQGWQAYSR